MVITACTGTGESGKPQRRLSRFNHHWRYSWTRGDTTINWDKSLVSLFHTERKYNWIGLLKSLACRVLRAAADILPSKDIHSLAGILAPA